MTAALYISLWWATRDTVQNLKKIICSLSVLCSPQLFLTRSPQISGQNMSEARVPEGLVKITYGIVASALFKRVGNSNQEKFLVVSSSNSWIMKAQVVKYSLLWRDYINTKYSINLYQTYFSRWPYLQIHKYYIESRNTI